MGTETIRYALDGAVARITLDDPATRNALTHAGVEALREALARAAREARCTLLTGAGKAFCAGANLAGGDLRFTPDLDIGRQLDAHFHPLVTELFEHPHPVVTAVHGAAAGIGCSLALLGDVIVASESAYFLQAFIHLGIVPDGGSTWLLPRLVGRARAMEMVLLGERLPAERALAWGLVNRVVPDDELPSAATGMAERLAQGPTQGLARVRRLLWDSAERTFQEQLHAERVAQREAGRTKDFVEGVTAFLEKRPPAFTGE